MILQRFPDVGQAATALAAQVALALRVGLAARQSATLVVPGGRTPVPLFHHLRQADLEWSRVCVTLTDERWVAESHESSNSALVHRELLVERARAATFYALTNAEESASAAAVSIWQSLRPLPRPFDAVVLGMGDDGHFASLFPASPGLAAALDPGSPPACVAMQAPTAPSMRISLNLAALLQARRLFLFITGARKRDLLLEAARSAAKSHFPVAALLTQRIPMPEVYWAP